MSDFKAYALLIGTILFGFFTLWFFNSNMSQINTQNNHTQYYYSSTKGEKDAMTQGSDNTTSNYHG